MPGSPGYIIGAKLTETGLAGTIKDRAFLQAGHIIDFAHDYATNQLNYLIDLEKEIINLVPVEIDFHEYNITVPSFSDPGYTYTRPTSPDAGLAIPPDPTKDAYLGVSVPDIPAFPAYTIPEPTIVEPLQPSIVMPYFTETTPVLEFVDPPEAPDVDYPDAIEMTPVVFSAIPELDFPGFDGIRPTIDLIPPPVYITAGDNNYQSNLLDEINAKLLNDVINGGTGLGAEIEQDIWERNQERDQLALSDSMTRATAEWAARGFDFPNGILAGMLIPLELEYMHKRTDTSRDISIKQAELAQTNTHFAIQQGLALEQIKINWANQVAERTFQASKVYTDALLAVFDAEVKKQSLLLEQYKADAQVFVELIKAEIAKLERFRIEVEMNKGIAEYDRNRVEVYKAQVEAIDTMIKSYGHEVDAVKAIAETQKTKMEAFKAAVEAYVAQVNSKTAEYTMYTAAWNGEKTKAEVYSTRVDAYGKRIASIQAEASAKLEVMKGQIEVNKDILNRYTTDIDFYKAKSSNYIAVIEERLKLFSSEVSRYQVDGNIYNNKTDLTIKQYDTEIQKYLKQAELSIKQAELDLKAQEFNSNQMIEARKAVATVAAHVAAGAMASLHASASLSASASGSENFSNQNQITDSSSYDVRESYSYTEE
jgi:hypothetical protein